MEVSGLIQTTGDGESESRPLEPVPDTGERKDNNMFKGLEKAVQRFNTEHEPYNRAIIDEIESYKGHYRIIIVDDWGFAGYYTFGTIREFIEWSKGVVFENEM